MKYKVGDKVRVRADLNLDNKYGGWSMNSEMIEFNGKVVTIKHCEGSTYAIEECGWAWTYEMFVGLAKDVKAPTPTLNGIKKIIVNDPAVVVIFDDDEKIISKAWDGVRRQYDGEGKIVKEVKVSEPDEFSAQKGLLNCLLKRELGSSKAVERFMIDNGLRQKEVEEVEEVEESSLDTLFKVGDIVEILIDEYRNIPKGTICEIIIIDDDSTVKVKRLDTNHQLWFATFEVKLIEEV